MSEIIRIANCSGFYGDRLDAARELLDGGPIDVLTGDYLAELTMSILHSQQQSRGAHLGYVGTFLKQLREVVADCCDRNIKIVTNAGGLNPQGMAAEVERIVAELGVDAKVAYIDGDNLIGRLDELYEQGEAFTNLDTRQALTEAGQQPLTANVYLGAWGIKEALDQGADIVVCPRVTDAAVVIGPAAWKFNWQRNDYDALAGALAAGHIIECGAQCCGGNYAFFEEVPSFLDMGYPIAEIAADGSFTVTKHPGTGGLVSVGTITAQLLYEISQRGRLLPLQLFRGARLRPDRAGRHLCARLPADRRGAGLWHHGAATQNPPHGDDCAMSEATAINPPDALIAENAAILDRFLNDGVHLEKITEFEFLVEFDSKQNAKDYLTALRPVMKSTVRRHGLKDFLFILCSYDDEGRYEIRMSIEMVPNAAHISAIEAAMSNFAPELKGGEVSWEFADPKNSKVNA